MFNVIKICLGTNCDINGMKTILIKSSCSFVVVKLEIISLLKYYITG